jgi:AcrR family transcriptional regulator
MAYDEHILVGARRALERHGWQDTTLERIATEAGTSRMTLHRRGVTRDGVLAALAERLEQQYRDALWPALTEPGDGRERLEHAMHALCGVMEGNLWLIAALGDRPRDAIFHEDGDDALTRSVFTEPVERLLRDGAADGSLRTVEDPRETATVLFNLIGWTYRHLRTGHGWSPERVERGVVSIALDGVAGGTA